jgi:LPS export ABC transporter protein LptC
MKKRVKLAVIFIGVLLVACIAGFINVWIITGGVKMSELTQDKREKSEKVLVKNILLTETKEGKKYWEIYAKSGQYINNSEKVLLNEAMGNFYNENGEVILSFSSDNGEYDSKNKRVILKNNAKLASKNETQMEAHQITWEGVNNIVHSEGNVRAMQAEKLYITCDRSTFTTDFKDFHVYGHTITRVYDKGLKK